MKTVRMKTVRLKSVRMLGLGMMENFMKQDLWALRRNIKNPGDTENIFTCFLTAFSLQSKEPSYFICFLTYFSHSGFGITKQNALLLQK
jgi:hypothetical protein